MNKLLYTLFAVFALSLWACTSENTSVSEIAQIINDGAQKEQAFEQAVANGEKTEADLQEGDILIRPDGNVFANPTIKTIIEKNSNYKLSSDDKKILTEAIDNLCPAVSTAYHSTTAGSLSATLKEGERNLNLSKIEDAKTLGDLL